MAKKENINESTEATFTQEQLLHSQTLGFNKDILRAVTEECKEYTIEQAKDLINKYLNKEIKKG